jgi:hypothetical protein
MMLDVAGVGRCWKSREDVEVQQNWKLPASASA